MVDFPPITGIDEPGSGTRSLPPKDHAFPELAGYKILEELPRGGQALVYKAVHKATMNKVALKVLPPGLLVSAKARHLFAREVELISGLDHPYIVHIRDSGVAEGQYYFAMEYIHGQPLDQYTGAAGLSPRATMELLLKVCEAVAYAHRRGVIHRDLKPSNILIDQRGEPHILDFGLAKSADRAMPDASLVSLTGEIKGTLSYMSPEQASGRSDLVDTRSDVYSLGVVFYQVLTHKFPYDVSGTTVQTLRNIQSTDPARPRNLLRKFDSDLEAILLRALGKDPGERYSSAAELGEDIRRWLQGLPINARLSTLYLLRKLVRRNALPSAVLGLLAVIVLGFSCTYYYLYGQLRAKHARLEETVVQLHEERQASSRLYDQLMFEHILNLWHRGQQDQVKAVGRQYLDEEGREQQALEFLLDGRPLAQKSDAFRRELGAAETFFATLVIAEHHLRDGDRRAALTLYRQSLGQAGARRDAILCYHVRNRISELMETEDAKDR